MIRRTLCLALVVFLSAGIAGCASWPKRWGDNPCCVQAKPEIRRQSIGWHLFDVSVIEPLKQCVHLVRLSRKWAGSPVRANNLKGGEVPDTTFFTNRDIAALSPEQVRWGPTRPEDLPVAPYTITKPKIEGKTAGFFVKDARGQRYLFKLDPVDNPQLLSGAEVVTSKLFHALGYHVPSYEIVEVALQELIIGEGAQMRMEDKTLAPFTPQLLDALLVPRLNSGKVRVCSSKILDGEILGPAQFKKFRDCADVRALKVLCAWVNHIDTKDHNSLLVWDGKRTVGYLIDFGTSLGADAGLGGPKEPCEGSTYAVDLKEWSLELVTLGIHKPTCDFDSPVFSPTIGRFTDHVDPDAWKPYAPNWAFNTMNQQDARWITRRLSLLTREQIAAAVGAGSYSSPTDAQALIERLIRRRDGIVQRYLEEESPDGP
jgi:hypothetical protein